MSKKEKCVEILEGIGNAYLRRVFKKVSVQKGGSEGVLTFKVEIFKEDLEKIIKDVQNANLPTHVERLRAEIIETVITMIIPGLRDALEQK